MEEVRAVTNNRLEPVNIDIWSVVTRGLCVSEIVAPLREEVARLPGFNIAVFDRLPSYTYALMTIHSRCVRRPSKANVSESAGKVMSTRDRLLTDLAAAKKRQLIVGTMRADFGGNRTYLELASDLAALVMIFRNHWTKLEGKTAISLIELAEAQLLSVRFLKEIAFRSQPIIDARAQKHLRAQAFTVFVHAYEEVRRAVSYLRWSMRDKLVPSLYAGRCKGRWQPRAPQSQSEHATLLSTTASLG
jgi:hypothetical protein